MRAEEYIAMLSLLGGVALTGCEDKRPDWKSTTDFATGGTGGDTNSLVTITPEVCPGVCVRAPSVPFERVAVFTIGKPDELLPCSDLGSSEGFVGYRDLTVAEMTCPTCSCGPATCTLPDAIRASSSPCSGGESVPTPWDPPANWDGSCSAEGAIPEGLQCEPYGDCVASITVAPPTVSPCAPVTSGTPDIPDPEFGLVARECVVQPTPDGCAIDESCIPALPDGFRACLFLTGEDAAFDCPEVYSDRLVVYAQHDTRACEPCSCGEPAGEECAAFVAAFTDGACGKMLASTTIAASDDAACIDVLSGSALGSKEAQWTIKKAGTCDPTGGAKTGALALNGAVTLCCQPESGPAK